MILIRGYTMTKGATTLEVFKNGVYGGLGWGLGFLFIVLVFLLIFVDFNSPLNRFHYKCAAVSPRSSSTQPSATPPMRGGNPVISVTDLRNDIIAYYNTFITILVALLGATAIIGYLHLRHISKEEAERRASKAVERCFDLEKTHRLIDERIGIQVEEWINDEDMIPGRLTILEGQVEYLRQFSDIRSDLDEESEQN